MSLSQALAKSDFDDTHNHWAEASITKAVYHGYVEGYPNGNFQPEAAVSRAEFIKMLVAAINPPIVLGTGEWYQPYLKASVNSGVHQYADFTQDINGEISRMEIIRLIVRAANSELQKSEITVDDKALVYSAAKKGLIQGLAEGHLGLNESTSRAQAVSVVERVLRLKDGGVLPVDKTAVELAELSMTGTNFMTVLGHPAFKEFPVEYWLGDVGLTVNQITVVDADEDDSKRSISTAWGDEKAERYMLLFQLSWDLCKSQQDIRISDYFQITESQSNPIQTIGPEIAAYQESSATTTTELGVSLTKKQLDEYIANGGLSYTVAGSNIPLFYSQR
ncbi:S-layer homology domain-containing protein [Paenibacillus sp. 1_12]|nr:S-layer homology domain-containing protein [Paenibacillus sp. 1_12]